MISPERRKELLAQHQVKKIPQLGAQFRFPDYNFIIDLNAADVVEMVWATDEVHHTDHHIMSVADKKKMTAKKAATSRQQATARKRKRGGNVGSGKTVGGYLAGGGPEGDPPPPPPAGDYVVAYASCSQVAHAVVGAIEEVMNMRGDMTDEEWEEFHPTIAENYQDEVNRKIQAQNNSG